MGEGPPQPPAAGKSRAPSEGGERREKLWFSLPARGVSAKSIGSLKSSLKSSLAAGASHTTSVALGGRQRVKLTPFEYSRFMKSIDGIATLTFFDGSLEKGAAWLSQRLPLVLQANPWLAGGLHEVGKEDRVEYGELELEFPWEPTDQDLAAVFCSKHPSLKVKRTTPYTALYESMMQNGCIVEPAAVLMAKGKPVTRVTLCETVGDDSGSPTFALVVSVSHVVADGATYYQVLRQLSGDAPIIALSPVRRYDLSEKVIDMIGLEECLIWNKPGVIASAITTEIRCKRRVCFAHMVDNQKVEAAKLAASARMEAGSGNAAATDGAPFTCSTNDVITSAYGRAVRTRLLSMAIDGRNRIEAMDATLAGNYEGSAVYPTGAFEFPERIRQSLRNGPPFKRVQGSLPTGFWTGLRCRFAAITSWVFPVFKTGLQLAGDPESAPKMALHLPLAKYSFPVAVIFYVRPGQLAFLVVASSKKLSARDIGTSDLPLGGVVQPGMFEDVFAPGRK